MDLNRLPIRTPIPKPTNEIVKTTSPITKRLRGIDTSKKASETPTASASILVANAKVNVLLLPTLFSCETEETEVSAFAPSQIIFIPKSDNKKKAIQ